MIEKYLQKGVRIKWSKPKDVMPPSVGAVIASTQAANTMTYDGLDGELQNAQFMAVNVATSLGLRMGQQIPHTWLDYAPGGIATIRPGSTNILTGWMSGCPIIKYNDGGSKIAHVGTMDNNDAVNKLVKQEFRPLIKADPTATGFSPSDSWPDAEIGLLLRSFKKLPMNYVLGLVTGHGRFYAVLIFSIPSKTTVSNEWCIGGIKPGTVLNQAQLLQKLA